MEINKTDLEGVLVIDHRIFGDHRGWFTETYSRKAFRDAGIEIDFVQDNHSMSAQKGTLRGLHCQTSPHAQTKLIRCTRGKILDVAVDLRRGSSTYLKWTGVELSEENKRQLLIPKGFAHGFLTLTDNAEVQYKVDAYYAPDCDRSIRFNDPAIGVQWGIDDPVLSEKDKNAPLLRNSDVDFAIRILVTGADGQLGHDVVRKLDSMKLTVLAPGLDEFDLTNAEQVRQYILSAKPDVIIHCAAYTAVDKAEDEQALCYAVNVSGTRTVAEAAALIRAKLVYVSTDYVFDGSGDEPHGEDDTTAPLNYYGFTKEQGEKAVRENTDRHYIVRTSWIYGINGNNFVKTMLRLAKTKSEISVVSDQVGAPTYTRDLADFIASLIQTDRYGTYHGVNEGFCSWYEFAQAIFTRFTIDMKINPISTADYPARARRPQNSRLAKDRTDQSGLRRLPHWEDALARFADEIKSSERKCFN